MRVKPNTKWLPLVYIFNIQWYKLVANSWSYPNMEAYPEVQLLFQNCFYKNQTHLHYTSRERLKIIPYKWHTIPPSTTGECWYWLLSNISSRGIQKKRQKDRGWFPSNRWSRGQTVIKTPWNEPKFSFKFIRSERLLWIDSI